MLIINYIEGKSPPYCTHVSKGTDHVARFKYEYPPTYIPPGKHETYQKMFCLNPAAVNKAVTVVCDLVAPPQVQFTLGDDYMHVVRQDPSGRFLSRATITTYQLCSHNMTNEIDLFYGPDLIITEFDFDYL
ncbi:unnamed protein product, partial [Brenthis ino]